MYDGSDWEGGVRRNVLEGGVGEERQEGGEGVTCEGGRGEEKDEIVGGRGVVGMEEVGDDLQDDDALIGERDTIDVNDCVDKFFSYFDDVIILSFSSFISSFSSEIIVGFFSTLFLIFEETIEVFSIFLIGDVSLEFDSFTTSFS